MTPTNIVTSIYEALGRRDLPFILGQLAPDVAWQGPPTVPWGGMHRGPEGVMGFFAALNENFELTGMAIKDTLASGDQVVTIGSFQGQGRKTGKPAATDFCWVWRIRDGKVTHYQGHFDTAAVMAAITPG